MSRPPPRSTRTGNTLPHTALFRTWADMAQRTARTRRPCGAPDEFRRCLEVMRPTYIPRRLPPRPPLVAVAPTCVRGGKRLGAHSDDAPRRSEEHTSELQSLMRISYAVFCLKKKNNTELLKRTPISTTLPTST